MPQTNAMTRDSIAVDAADRATQINAFIAQQPDWVGSIREALRIDASVRRYYRLRHPDGKTAVLMDARPPLEDTATFAFMAQKLARLGFSVPTVYATDHESGLILMEDFGDETFFDLLTAGKESPEKLLTLAVDALVHKYRADPAVALEGCVAYSDEYWLFRVEQFLKFYLPLDRGATLPPDAHAEYLAVFKRALDAAHHFPPVLLHGDYGAQNLFYLAERPGIRALGVIDFQDMTDARGNMSGSPAFDLVFLLQDVRMSFPDGLETTLKARFIEGANIPADQIDAFNAEYATISAAQAAKCLGLFARLGHQDGRAHYLDFIPNCWRNLRGSLQHPALAEVKAWFEKYVPEMG